ncbi:hypothetical protein [Streptomyces kaempferi]|uniref:Uncharacterized protein n=1 Tax=Streptomyces kaempferi TaxID=333725 RepID=A0ABW3XI38_9ACTN
MTTAITHEGDDPLGTLTEHRGLLENCGAPGCEERARSWKDGDPLMEAIATAVFELCEHSDSGGLVVDDPRNIAAAASLAAIRILGRDRCVHSKAVHNTHHVGSPVPDCAWCTTTSPADRTTPEARP